MATKGTAAKSTSGASISPEVEARLSALEEQAHTPCGGGSDDERIAALEAKVDDLIGRLSKKISF